MSTRNLDFSDGFESSTAPTAGDVTSTQVGAYADDTAFETAVGRTAALGDVYFNTTSGFFRVHNGTQFDDYVNDNDDQTVAGDKTFTGTTTFINSTNLEVTDQNITVNKNGNDASAEDGGLTVERTGTDGALKYEDALASKWKGGADGSEVEFANVSSAQTLTNKTIDGNNNTLTVLAGSQLSGNVPIANGGTGQATQTDAFDALAPSTTKGDLIVHNGTDNIRVPVGADNQVLVADATEASGVKWDTASGGGSGTGAINHITNGDFEVDITGWSTYADAAQADPEDGTGGAPSSTFVRNTTSPLRDTGDGQFSKDSVNRQGEGFSFDFTIDLADRASQQTISFDYNATANFEYNGGTAGDESDIMVWIYDVTNAALVGSPLRGLDGSGRFVSSFQTAADSSDYRLIFHVATTNASSWIFQVDNVQVGPSSVVSVDGPVTDWESFTAGGAFTNTTYSGQFRRIGDSAEIIVDGTLTGTPGASSLVVNLPSGLSIDTAKLNTAVDQRDPLGSSIMNDAGIEYAGGVVYNSTTTARVTIGNSSGSNLLSNAATNTVPFTWASGDTFHTRFIVPIAGWGSGKESAVAADSNRPVFMRASGNPASATTGNPIIWPDKDFDTHNAYNSSTGEFTVPVTGYYQISVFQLSSTANIRFGVAKDGVVDVEIGISQDPGGDGGALGVFQANAGEVVTFESTNGTMNIADGWMSIHKLDTGSPLAALTEDVVAIYEIGSPADTDLDYNAFDIVDYDTKVVDTHNAVTTGASWSFTVPRTGYYTVSASVHFQSAGVSSALTRQLAVSVFVDSVETRSLGSERVDQTSFARVMHVDGSCEFYFEAGQSFNIQAFQNVTNAVAQTLTLNSVVNYVTIKSVG